MIRSRASSTTLLLTGNLPAEEHDRFGEGLAAGEQGDHAFAAIVRLPEQPDPAVEDDIELACRLALDEQHCVVGKASDRGLGDQIGQPAGLEAGEERHAAENFEVALLEADAPRQALEHRAVLDATDAAGMSVHRREEFRSAG